MQALVQGLNGRQLVLDIALEDFLSSGLMYRQAKVAMCDSGEELLRDCVCEDAAAYGDEELAGAIADALFIASDSAVTNVQLEQADIVYIRRHFGSLSFAPAPPLTATFQPDTGDLY